MVETTDTMKKRESSDTLMTTTDTMRRKAAFVSKCFIYILKLIRCVSCKKRAKKHNV